MLSVVIPALNEENAIVETIQEIRTVLDEAQIKDYEIIIVDDGSRDSTGQRALEAGARVIRHPHNVGYGAALKSGIRAAFHETIIISDADKTYPFEKVPELLAEKAKGFDMVVGARTGKHYRQSIMKSGLRWVLKSIVEFTAGRKVPDINSGLRVFNKSTVIPYFNHLCNTFSFTTSQTLAYMMTGKFVKYVEIPYMQREGNSKVRLFRDSLRTLQYIVQAATYYNPLKIFILFSFICIFFSLVGFGLSIILHLLSGFLLGIGGVLVALVVFSIGLLADLLKQIMDK